MSLDDEDRIYYQRRAEAEVEKAREARHPAAVSSHYRLAEAYLEKAGGDEARGRSGPSGQDAASET
jgi:hypothetical protein